MPFLGAHTSTAGGLHKAFQRIKDLNGTALQIFTKNQRQWNSPTLGEEDLELYRKEKAQWGNYPVASHDSYLINLASTDETVLHRSVTAFAHEVERCELLDIPFLVTHPGSHKGLGIEEGLKHYTANLDVALDKAQAQSVMVLLETTAGQGTNLGSTFEELAEILSTSKHRDRLGVCYDTCHTFAAGYDIRSQEAYEKTFARFEKILGLEHLRFFHLNDSKNDMGTEKDRHEHIGKGFIGLQAFGSILNDPRFGDVPMVIETPKDKKCEFDEMNLSTLRSLIT